VKVRKHKKFFVIVQQLKMSSSSQQQKEKYIPDISYHLIFCFLNISELRLISLCSHHFKRLVTNKSFITMYLCEETIIIKNSNNLPVMFETPLQNVVKKLEYHGSVSPSILESFKHFPHLQKIKLFNYSSHLTIYHKLSPVFLETNTIPLHSLQEFCVVLYSSISYYDFITLFSSFVSLNPNLKTLDIQFLGFVGHHIHNLSKYILKLSQLKQLEVLKLNFSSWFYESICPNIIDTVRRLPVLRVLDVDILFPVDIDNSLENLRQLCAQPGAPPALTTIGSFDMRMSQSQQLECVQLLQQLPLLHTIDLLVYGNNHAIPTSLVPWIETIMFQSRFFDNDFKPLSLFHRLHSLILIGCYIDDDSFGQLLRSIASSLKKLKVVNQIASSTFSLITISACIHLTHLELENCSGFFIESELYFLLTQCSKLQQIEISNCDFNMMKMSKDEQEALKIPSKLFSSLKKCDII
jgi:hypothetical protein